MGWTRLITAFAVIVVLGLTASLIGSGHPAAAAELTTMSGTVRQVSGGVLSGVGVRAVSDDGTWRSDTVSAPDGTFELRVPTGVAWLGVWWPDRASDYYVPYVLVPSQGRWGTWSEAMSAFPVTVTPDMRLDLTIPMSDYTVRVVDQEGRLAGGALLVNTGLAQMTTDAFTLFPGAEKARVNNVMFTPSPAAPPFRGDQSTQTSFNVRTMPGGDATFSLPTLSATSWSIWPVLRGGDYSAVSAEACGITERTWLTFTSSQPMGVHTPSDPLASIWNCWVQYPATAGSGPTTGPNPEPMNAFLERNLANRVLTVQYSDKPGSYQFATITKADLLDGQVTVQLPYLSRVSARASEQGADEPQQVMVQAVSEDGDPLPGVVVTLDDGATDLAASSGLVAGTRARGRAPTPYPQVTTDARGRATIGIAPGRKTAYRVVATNLTTYAPKVTVRAASYLPVKSLTARVSTSKVRLTWKRPRGQYATQILQYRAAGSPWVTVSDSIRKSARAYTWKPSVDGRYQFRVAVRRGAVNGTWSPVAAAIVK